VFLKFFVSQMAEKFEDFGRIGTCEKNRQDDNGGVGFAVLSAVTAEK
jgi:hypothetical protein